MVKHASSHGFAVLVCSIASSFIVELIKPQWPDLVFTVQDYCKLFIVSSHIPMSPEWLSVMLLASVLSLIWGVFFHFRYKKGYNAKTAI